MQRKFGWKTQNDESNADPLDVGLTVQKKYGQLVNESNRVPKTIPSTRKAASLEDAVARVALYPPVNGIERVDLSEATSRILAEDVTAPRPVPEYDNSAVDGYAFRMSDLPADGRMPISGRAAAGHPFRGRLPPLTAVRIFTGGVIPDGSDTVAMQEDCSPEDGMIVLPTTLELGANRRLAGDDIAQNATVLTGGTRLRPQDIGIAAAVGQSTLLVHQRIQVAVIAQAMNFVRRGSRCRRVAHTTPIVTLLLLRFGPSVRRLRTAA